MEAIESSASFHMRLETVPDALVTPFRLTDFPPRPSEKASMSGCVHRADGSKVEISERFGGHRGDWIRSVNPDVVEAPAEVRRLDGRALYLGHYMGPHYGHFITETLSTFWCFERLEAQQIDHFIFHPFAFGTKIPAHVRYCFDVFGISLEKVVFAEETPLGCRELLVPERLFRLNHSADPRVKWVYDRLARAATSSATEVASRRVYVSRRRFSFKNTARVVANEVSVERLFKAHGFEVIYPEELSFQEQISLYARATHLAGQSGSALHNALFMPSGGTVIELGDFRYGGEPTPTQALCDQIAGVQNLFVPFRGRRLGQKGAMIFDMRALIEALAPVLGETRGGYKQAGDLLEIAYLALRPAVGGLARGAMKKIRRR